MMYQMRYCFHSVGIHWHHVYIHRGVKYVYMKKVLIIGTVLMGMLTVAANAQSSDRSNTEKNTNEKRNQPETQGTIESPAGAEELLGDSNDNRKKRSNQDPSSEYRDNEVTGNPNNTNVNEGSNRRSTVQPQGEGSTAVPAVNPHNTNQTVTNPGSSAPADEAVNDTSGTNEGSASDEDSGDDGATGSASGSQNSNAPSIIQETSSQSGSPAVLSEQNGTVRDGTNNVQRAEPNMAGSKSTKGAQGVNEDEEIRKGSQSQMNNPAGSNQEAVDASQNQGGANSSGQPSEMQPQGSNDESISSDGNNRPAASETSKRPKGAKAPGKKPTENPGFDSPEGENPSQRDGSISFDETTVPAMDQNADLITESDKQSNREKRKERRRNRKNRD
jgi:hypothetical protein